jgi:hypothetical protein
MWRPLEIFLYDWWSIRVEARLSDRLAFMPVRIRYLNAKEPDAWRADWPAAGVWTFHTPFNGPERGQITARPVAVDKKS